MGSPYGFFLYGEGGYKGDFSSSFLGTPTTGEIPLTVQFNISLSEDENVIDYNWDFGDGATSKDQNPTHIYRKAGIYTISLVIGYDADGQRFTDRVARNDYITVYSQGYVVRDFNKSYSIGLGRLNGRNK